MRVFSLKCREFIEFLNRYIDGELSPKEQREFQWHLRLCRSCRAYLRTYRATLRFVELTRAQLEREVADPVPEELVQAILAARAG